MRLSRSKISVDANAQQLLAAQQLAQNPSLSKAGKAPEVPPLPTPTKPAAALPVPPPPPPIVAPAKPAAPPAAGKLPVPPPPPPAAFTPPPPPPPVAQPGRPQFKDPAPESADEDDDDDDDDEEEEDDDDDDDDDDDEEESEEETEEEKDKAPPRPSFKEPPPEKEEEPPRPKFADPPRERAPAPAAASPPATPTFRSTGATQQRGSISSISSVSPSPTNEDVVLGSGKASISRTGSAQAAQGASVTRGPRFARGAGPRGPAGGTVQSLVSNLNRTSVSGPPSGGGSGTPSSPKVPVNRLSGSPVRRPSSVVGRSAASFSRRTMASDAEDDVVDRK